MLAVSSRSTWRSPDPRARSPLGRPDRRLDELREDLEQQVLLHELEAQEPVQELAHVALVGAVARALLAACARLGLSERRGPSRLILAASASRRRLILAASASRRRLILAASASRRRLILAASASRRRLTLAASACRRRPLEVSGKDLRSGGGRCRSPRSRPCRATSWPRSRTRSRGPRSAAPSTWSPPCRRPSRGSAGPTARTARRARRRRSTCTSSSSRPCGSSTRTETRCSGSARAGT